MSGAPADLEPTRRAAWDRFARRDALFHVDPNTDDEDEFLAAGRRNVARVMDWLGEDAARGRMLEIGCGPARTAEAFATVFERVDGVDVSPEMLRLAQARPLPANLVLTATSGADLAPFEDGSFDFVFSHLVFQHIDEEGVVASYLREVARVLAPQGLALLQFDTRPPSRLAAGLAAMPDRLLPRSRRRHMRRHRRDPARLRALAHAAGLEPVREHGEVGPEHWFFLRPSER
jgi:SAM-dependent methyltransferase